MPTNLHRYYGAGYSHFVTTSCYQRRPLLGTPRSRDLFLEVMEQIRQRHQFVVVGYVVMPEHVHLLFSEPERGNPSLVLAALKQTFAHRLLRELRATSQADALWSTPVAVGHVWQRRFYDFVVFTENKRVEKLRYMHRNPVQRGLVLRPTSGCGAASAITPMGSAARFWSMRPEKQSFKSAKSLDPDRHRGPPVKPPRVGHPVRLRVRLGEPPTVPPPLHEIRTIRSFF